MFTEICKINLEDSITFEVGKISKNQEDKNYGGFCIKIRYGKREVINFDVSCGEVILPNICKEPINSFVEGKIEVYSYPVETIIAEKLQSILVLGDMNTRMKDFGDIYSILSIYKYDKKILKSTIVEKFTQRKSLEIISDYKSILNNKLIFEKDNGFWDKYIDNETTLKDIDFRTIVKFIISQCDNLEL